MSDGHYSIYAPCAMCYSNLNPSRIPYHSSYHVIPARGRSVHPGTVRHVSSKCLTIRHLTPEPSMAVNYVFVAATCKYIFPRMLCYPHVLIALIIFDTLLSLPSEIKYIWCQKPRLGSILYTLARYSTCNWDENLEQRWIMDERRRFLYRVGQIYNVSEASLGSVGARDRRSRSEATSGCNSLTERCSYRIWWFL